MHVGGVERLLVRPVRRLDGDGGAEPDPHEQRHPGRDVEPDGAGEPALQRAAADPQQRAHVPEHDHGQQRGRSQGDGGQPRHHPDQDADDAEVEPDQPGHGRTARGLRGPQQGDREVLPPDDHGVGHRPEQQQVDGQPALVSDPAVRSQHDDRREDVGQHDGVRAQLPAAPGPTTRSRHRPTPLPHEGALLCALPHKAHLHGRRPADIPASMKGRKLRPHAQKGTFMREGEVSRCRCGCRRRPAGPGRR